MFKNCLVLMFTFVLSSKKISKTYRLIFWKWLGAPNACQVFIPCAPIVCKVRTVVLAHQTNQYSLISWFKFQSLWS